MKTTPLKTPSFLMLVFLLISGFGYGQTKEIDSLKVQANKNLNDTIKISKYLSIAQAYMTINVDSFNSYNQKALSLSLLNENYLLARVYSNQGLSFIYSSKSDSARYFLDKSLKLLENSGDTEIKSAVLGNYAMSYQVDNDLENMSRYNLAAIEAIENDDKELSRLYYN